MRRRGGGCQHHLTAFTDIYAFLHDLNLVLKSRYIKKNKCVVDLLSMIWPYLYLFSLKPVTVTGGASTPLSATAWLATVFACKGCQVSVVTSVPEGSLVIFPTVNHVTNVSGTGIALYRCTFVWVMKASKLDQVLATTYHYLVSSPGLSRAYQGSSGAC